MPAGSTYTPIATQTLTSNANTVTFSSIPATYTDLILQATILQNGTATATNGFFQLNSTTTGYSKTTLQSNGSTPFTARQTNMDRGYYDLDPSASNWAFHTYHFMNYSNTTTNKTVLSRQNLAGNSATNGSVHLWRNTAAINAVSITASDNMGSGTADQFVSGSTFTLYGITAA
jgi:hypothetical protein